MRRIVLVLLLIFCLIFSSFSAGAIKAKGSSSNGDSEEDQDIEDIEDQGGDIDSSSSILEKLKEGNGGTGVNIIKPFDDISADLSTRGDWSIAVDEVDLEDAPASIRLQVRSEVNMLKNGEFTYLTGAESLLVWVINEAANNIGRGDQPFTTAVQENEMNTPAAVVATSGEVDFQGFEWKPPSDRDELGTISALGKEEKLSTVTLFPPLVKMTGESDD